ncbi:hypothetical protein [Chishuiella sp.]|uniref:hypothetical protein n=1 Tax=Chishuiella sp. TaxID=1969467 RepID=UPI0028A93D14|nr:hypothetical protein [Chishuiella sp.]
MKKIIQIIIKSLNERKILKEQYLQIEILSNKIDFKTNLEIYNLILIFNRKSANWDLEKINKKFNFLLAKGTPTIDLYMKFIIQYESVNQKHYLELNKLCESFKNLGKIDIDFSQIHKNIQIKSNKGFL